MIVRDDRLLFQHVCTIFMRILGYKLKKPDFSILPCQYLLSSGIVGQTVDGRSSLRGDTRQFPYKQQFTLIFCNIFPFGPHAIRKPSIEDENKTLSSLLSDMRYEVQSVAYYQYSNVVIHPTCSLYEAKSFPDSDSHTRMNESVE